MPIVPILSKVDRDGNESWGSVVEGLRGCRERRGKSKNFGGIEGMKNEERLTVR